RVKSLLLDGSRGARSVITHPTASLPSPVRGRAICRSRSGWTPPMIPIKIFCFLASYTLALGLELWHHFRPHPAVRRLAQLAGAAGLIAQTLYLADKGPPLAKLSGSALLLAWILAIFYLFGSLHYQR